MAETKIVITAETAQAESAMRSLGQSVGGVSKHMFNLSSMTGTLRGALTITAFAGFIKSTIDAADNLNDLAQKTGIGIEALAGYKLAAEQSGTSLETVAKGVKGLSIYMVDHGDKLKKLGITATDSNGAMMQLADVFAKLPDSMTRTKLATDIFTKANVDMIPMLSMGSQGLADAQEKAAEYGRRMKELAPDADKFNDRLAELSLQASVAGINLASLVTGPMAQWLEANNQGIRIAGGATEALRLFVFNLDAMTSEKPVEEIKRLTKALEDYQAASSFGKFMQSPTGFLFGGREDDLKKQITFLEFLKKQEDSAAQPAKTKPARTPEQAAAEILKQRDFDASVRKIIGDDKPAAKIKKQKPFDPEGDFWFAVDEAHIKNSAKAREQASHDYAKSVEDANRIIFDLDPIAKASAEWENLAALKAQGLLTDEQIGKSYLKTFGQEHDGMQILLGLEKDFQIELEKRRDALNAPLLSASEKALADDMRTVTKRAQDSRIELEKLHVAGSLSAKDYDQRLLQVTADEIAQKDAVRALNAEYDRLNASWQYGADVALRQYLDEVQNVAKSSQAMFTNAFKGMEDALVNFVKTGKLDFKSLADSIIEQMIRISTQQSITGPLAGWLGGILGGGTPAPETKVLAAGGVMSGAGIGAYSGQVVSTPTLFPFANGIGLMGEAGAEGIFPLKRGKDGKLGISANGGGSTSTSVVVHNYGGSPATTKETTDNRGNRKIEIVIGEMVAAEVQRPGSAANKSVRNGFGLQPMMVGR